MKMSYLKDHKALSLIVFFSITFSFLLFKSSADIKNLKTNLKMTDQKTSVSQVFYKTPDDAAKAWVIKYNPARIPSKNKLETGSYIFSCNGMYGYTSRDIGYPNSIQINENKVPKGSQIIGAIHSHSKCGLLGQIVLFIIGESNDNFSAADFDTSQKYKVLAYMYTPTGYLKKYSPFTKTTIVVNQQ